MTGLERIMAAIEHREGDRAPLNLWNYNGGPGDMGPQAIERYGSVEGWYERFGLDMHTAFLPLPPLKGRFHEGPLRDDELDVIEFEDLPDSAGDPIKAEIAHHHSKGRAIFIQINGVHEAAAGLFGIENALMTQAMEREKFGRLLGQIADAAIQQAQLAAKLGGDVIHVSDDWGATRGLMFSPNDWWELVYPEEKRIVDEIKRLGKPASLHSDGNVNEVLEGIIKLGFDVLHPCQTSAGMDPYAIKAEWGARLTLYGTLDIVHLLPHAPLTELESEVTRRMQELKVGGGYLFCTEHSLQTDTTWERIELAFDTALKWSWY